MAEPKAGLPASDLSGEPDDADAAGSEHGLVYSFDEARTHKGLGVLPRDGGAAAAPARKSRPVPPHAPVVDPGSATQGYTKEELAAQFFGDDDDFLSDTPKPSAGAPVPAPAIAQAAPAPPIAMPAEPEEAPEEAPMPSRGRLAAMFMGVSAGAAMVVLVAGMLVVFVVAITWSYNDSTIARARVAPTPPALPKPEPTVVVEPPMPEPTEVAQATVVEPKPTEPEGTPTEEVVAEEPAAAPEPEPVAEPRNCRFYARDENGSPVKDGAGRHLISCENGIVYAGKATLVLAGTTSGRWTFSDLNPVENPPALPDP